jgi:hypothetical protein
MTDAVVWKRETSVELNRDVPEGMQMELCHPISFICPHWLITCSFTGMELTVSR